LTLAGVTHANTKDLCLKHVKNNDAKSVNELFNNSNSYGLNGH